MSTPSSYTASTNLDGESISALKQFLTAHGVSSAECLEKSELVEKVKQTLKFQDCQCSGHGNSSTSHAPPAGSQPPSATSSRYSYESIPVGPLQCNSVLIVDHHKKQGFLIDPGGDEQKLIDLLKEKAPGIEITHLLLTHAHFDHFLALAALKKHTGAKVCLHADDLMLYNALAMQCMMLGMPAPAGGAPPTPDILLTDGFDLPLAEGKVFHTPGHSPGSICFYFPPLSLLCSGDTLFRQSVGRTDLMGGNSAALKKSIQNALYALPDETLVIPGHNEKTNIGWEKRNNAVVKAKI